jgi:hypothetical protein
MDHPAAALLTSSPCRANPIPASSGQITRHRLNRSGDRQLNRAFEAGNCLPNG